MTNVIPMTERCFDSVLEKASKPVLVDFYADWCGPCKTMAPVLADISEKDPRFFIGQLDVDTQAAVAIEYGVQSMPTFILFEDGVEVARLVGARSEDQLLADLKDYL